MYLFFFFFFFAFNISLWTVNSWKIYYRLYFYIFKLTLICFLGTVTNDTKNKLKTIVICATGCKKLTQSLDFLQRYWRFVHYIYFLGMPGRNWLHPSKAIRCVCCILRFLTTNKKTIIIRLFLEILYLKESCNLIRQEYVGR